MVKRERKTKAGGAVFSMNLTDKLNFMRLRWMVLGTLLPACSFAQTPVSAAARRGIDAGNQAWVEAMKRGEAKLIAAWYAEDAVDCSAAGECLQGRDAIERQFAERARKLGRASSASVTSKGASEQGDFVYEWGEARASFPNGSRVAGNYLTVWRAKPGGGWEIFRNIAIPAGANR